jgi:hypothetical protein
MLLNRVDPERGNDDWKAIWGDIAQYCNGEWKLEASSFELFPSLVW